MCYTTSFQRLLLAGGLASSLVLSAKPMDNSYMGGLFKRTESDPAGVRPLPPVQKLAELTHPNQFRITDPRTGESFVMAAMAAYPVTAATAAQDLAEDIADDGKTLVAPVDLTGSGVSDLLYARQGWGGWKVLTNGNRMPKPFHGFVAGLFDRGQEACRPELIQASTHDLEVDPDLLTVVGDFLGNGTEQLAYTRPGWNQFWVVGAHGAVQMAADLKGIEACGGGPRQHWLFPFGATRGAKHTRFAYYRMGGKELIAFSPRGMSFHRETVSLEENWHKLCGKTLPWPREAPGKVEQAMESGKELLGRITGKD